MRWTTGATGEPVHPLSASQIAPAIGKLLSGSRRRTAKAGVPEGSEKVRPSQTKFYLPVN